MSLSGALLDPVLLAHLIVVFVPGLALAAALGLRGWLLAGLAPLLTYGIVGVAGAALPAVGIGWSPLTLTVTATIAALVAGSVRLAVTRFRPGTPAAEDALPRWTWVHHLGAAAGVAIGAGIGITVAFAGTDGFTAVPQMWDAVFHANATHYIAETGQSAPAALQNLNDPVGDRFYYPNTYHVLAATVVMLTSAAVPVVLDVSTAVFPVLLALGMVSLVRRSGGRPALAVAAAALSSAFTGFPYDVLPWGTLLPFIGAVSLLPAFLAGWSTALQGARLGVSVAVGLAGIGLLALHPSVAVAAALLGVALLAQLWYQRRPRRADARVLGVVTVSAVALGLPILAASLGGASGLAYDWPRTLNAADAIGQLLLLAHAQMYPQYWLVVLAVVGLFRRATLRPLLWFVGAGAVFGVLFVMAASYEGGLVPLLTAPWWNDKWRLAALWTLGVVMLAAAGLVGVRDGVWALATRVLPALRGITERRRLVAAGAILGVLVAALLVLTDDLYRDRNQARFAEAFTDGPAVSADERRAFEKLATLVPEGALVMNDPYDGSALMWALAGVRPVFATPVIVPQELATMEPNRRTLLYGFSRLDYDPRVQRAVAELDIHYVIVCEGFINVDQQHVTGMQNLDAVDALELVYESADARIYAIDRDGPVSG